MNQLSSPIRLPLPAVVRVLLLWLWSIVISSTMLLVFVVRTSGIHPTFMMITCILLGISLLPIVQFHNRSIHAINTSRLVSIFFGILALIASFFIVNIGEKFQLDQSHSNDLQAILNFSWITAMGLALTAALLFTFSFYVQHSKKVHDCLHTTCKQEIVPLGLGCLRMLSFLTIILGLRFFLGIAFFPNKGEEIALTFTAMVTLPHIFIAISLIICLAKKSPASSLFFRIATWITISLVTMAMRVNILELLDSQIPSTLINVFSLFLFTLPDTLIIALPLIWWSIVSKKEWKEKPQLSDFLTTFLELPLPLTIALIFIGFQGLSFAFGGVLPFSLSIPDITSPEQFSKVEVPFQIFPFSCIMLPISLFCIIKTLNNPYTGMGFCRIFCLASIALHGISGILILSSGLPAEIAAKPAITEAGLFCFISFVCYVALVIMQKILLLPLSDSKKTSYEQSFPNEHIDSSMLVEYHHSALESSSPSQITEMGKEESTAEHTSSSYLERVRPTLPLWLAQILPSKNIPLPVYMFFFFCLTLAAKWTIPFLLEAFSLFWVGGENFQTYSHALILLAFIGTAFSLATVFSIEKQSKAKLLHLSLTIWIAAVILLGIYPTLPGFSVMSYESVGIIAMICYVKESKKFQKWYTEIF